MISKKELRISDPTKFSAVGALTMGEILECRVPAELSLVRRYFKQKSQDRLAELRNPHVENPVSGSVKASAIKSAVLIPLIADREREPRLLVTKRQAFIRFAGHLCFPGGTSDESDKSAIDTALRESLEEIDIARTDIEILGCLGDYYTQAGYRITPVVGVIQHPADVRANPDEVASVHEISLAKVLDSENYKLTWHGSDRAHYSFTEEDIRIAGPTVSIMIGFMEELAVFATLSS
jgi:8-oxo-dGTP pyrophosphatase MutT (NUDIX family)